MEIHDWLSIVVTSSYVTTIYLAEARTSLTRHHMSMKIFNNPLVIVAPPPAVPMLDALGSHRLVLKHRPLFL